MVAFQTLQISFVLMALSVGPGLSPNRLARQETYGPEVKSFLEYIKHEEVELNFQIEHKEINRKDYIRSKSRLEILKQAVLTYVRESGKDIVPEYHVVAAPEVDDLIPGGTEALKGIKPGDAVREKWRYIGTAIRGEKFYIFERLSNI